MVWAGIGCRHDDLRPKPAIEPLAITQKVEIKDPYARDLVAAAMAQVGVTTGYDPAYYSLPYPMGDVDMKTGVCSDVIIRAFRKQGLDLQVAVHRDMRENFGLYPQLWGLRAPDPNIDHRRVPNLMKWFERQKAQKPKSDIASDYQPGDIVAWRISDKLLHIGIVTNVVADGSRLGIVHNWGMGAVIDDSLFRWEIIGHYRYRPA